jgi:hypothetical protein
MQGRWYKTHGEQQDQPSFLPGSGFSDAPRTRKIMKTSKNLLITLDIGSHSSNARCQLLPEAGATLERTLEAVSCKPWFGTGWSTKQALLCFLR